MVHLEKQKYTINIPPKPSHFILRNQFDLFRALPGGIKALTKVQISMHVHMCDPGCTRSRLGREGPGPDGF